MRDPTHRRPAPPLFLAAALAFALPAAAAGDSYQETLEKSYDAAGITRVRVQNVNGAVRVGTWEKPTIQLTAVKRARGSRAEAVVKETEIRITRSGSNLDVETIPSKQNRLFGFFSFGDGQKAEVTYDLVLPAPAGVDVETVNGRITAERRAGPLVLNTVNGSIKVDDHAATLHVNAVNGSVEVGFSGLLRDAELETVNGSVSVTCGSDSSFRYELETVNGKIRSEFGEVSTGNRWGPKEARGTLAGGRARLSVQTVNGDIRLGAAATPTVAPAAALR